MSKSSKSNPDVMSWLSKKGEKAKLSLTNTMSVGAITVYRLLVVRSLRP